MSALQSELLELRQKYEHLQHERDSQQEHLGRMQAELFAVRNQIQRQSQFCASLGAVMGNLIWKASRLPVVIDMFLSGNKVGDLLNIVNGSLISFLETYESCIPGQCTDESQFIMSVCGIVTNIAAAPAGRQFLISSSNGKELLEQFCRVLAHIPLPSGNALKRLLLMALYNTSINENGLRFLQQQQYLLSAITQDLQINTTSELKLMSLRLLQSLTYDIPNKSVLNGILKEVSLEMLQPMTQSSEAELKNVVGDIIDNINKALKKYGKNASQGDNQIRAKCPGSCDEALVYRAPCMQRTNIHNESPNACPSSGRCTKSISYKRIA
ncbi:heat shock factor 2-binding protein-like [Periplaneta americana]|uniref:heat shock factor 2-binding protein-like n=1 Tax=Periplaneta americana TaxID=6978 RepID=UPI0037E98161